ncbi:MAG TPA: MmcQ/YjbR family DNA-binding protein [Gaiellaceae bacterium]|nr:MmcQ/YjbR family DNA-binding protein [Gaiellaceae bacterium]
MAYPAAQERAQVLERLRTICLAFPETSERPSHGAPSFFVAGKRCFCMLLDDHHGDGIFGIWCAAPPGNQELLVAADPARFFRPPYVGHRGWRGVRFNDGVDWEELQGILEDAFATVAPRSLLG